MERQQQRKPRMLVSMQTFFDSTAASAVAAAGAGALAAARLQADASRLAPGGASATPCKAATGAPRWPRTRPPARPALAVVGAPGRRPTRPRELSRRCDLLVGEHPGVAVAIAIFLWFVACRKCLFCVFQMLQNNIVSFLCRSYKNKSECCHVGEKRTI